MTRIKELRESLGIKQEELAMLCGVTQSTISLWEIGRTVPRKRALEKLAERFGVSAGYILGIENAEVQDIQRLDLSEDEHMFKVCCYPCLFQSISGAFPACNSWVQTAMSRPGQTGIQGQTWVK